MTLQAHTQDQTVLLTIDQLSSVLGRNTAGNEQIASAIKLVGGLLSAAVTIYSAATVFQTVMSSRRNGQQNDDGLQFSKLDSAEMSKLHDWLDAYFDKDELMDICFDFDIDYEDLAGSGQAHKARELVEFCARRKMLPKLSNIVLAQRPHLAESRIGA